MIRALLANLAAAAVLVAAFFIVLVYTVPSRSAEACRGQMVTVSWFGKETCHGRPPGHGRGTCHTAAGIPFNGNQWLVAHKSLKFGTKVRFTLRGKSVTAPVLDRGPFVRARTYDLSRAVAAKLGLLPVGVDQVCAEIL